RSAGGSHPTAGGHRPGPDNGIPTRSRPVCTHAGPRARRADAFFVFNATQGIPMTDCLKPSLTRRTVLQAGAVAATGVSPALRALVYAQGSDAPEKKEVRIGFIPLTDCASVVMASVLGIDKKYGVTILPSKESSWAGVRDKLVNGELDFAHVLYGLIYGVQLGTAGTQTDMAVLMNLNQNGQAITLSSKLAEAGVTDGAARAKHMKSDPRGYPFAG